MSSKELVIPVVALLRRQLTGRCTEAAQVLKTAGHHSHTPSGGQWEEVVVSEARGRGHPKKGRTVVGLEIGKQPEVEKGEKHPPPILRALASTSLVRLTWNLADFWELEVATCRAYPYLAEQGKISGGILGQTHPALAQGVMKMK